MEVKKTATELVRSLRRREFAAAELASEFLTRIEQSRSLNAFLWAEPEIVLTSARRAGSASPLAGLPVAVKDNIDTASIRTTSGSMVDLDRVPDSDATAWARLRDRGGATLIGKAHLCEFAYRAHHPTLGWVRNPRRPDRATGGSSSGSAAAVAAALAPAALGSDSGGSVRIPAAYCGVVGFKGTYGAIETEGVVPLSPTMDHVGVLAATVADAGLVFDQMCRVPLGLVDADLNVEPADPMRLRVGVELGYFGARAQPAVLAAWSRAVRMLEAAGCRIVELDLGQAGRWRSAAKTILLHEAWLHHRRRIEAGAPYGPVFGQAISRGAGIGEQSYRRALAARNAACRALAAVFDTVDVIVTPTCPTVAPPVEEGRRGLSYTRFTSMAAFSGIPAISIPAGHDHRGLPIGAQLMSAWNHEQTLIQAAALLEALLEHSAPRNPQAP